jgi:hypothetical protein
MTVEQMIYDLVAILTPIVLYILAGFFAANQTWCWRKIVVAGITGLALGIYALANGTEVSDPWIQIAFASPAAIGGMYLVDRFVKGIAKRYGIEWLYADNPVEE